MVMKIHERFNNMSHKSIHLYLKVPTTERKNVCLFSALLPGIVPLYASVFSGQWFIHLHKIKQSCNVKIVLKRIQPENGRTVGL